MKPIVRRLLTLILLLAILSACLPQTPLPNLDTSLPPTLLTGPSPTGTALPVLPVETPTTGPISVTSEPTPENPSSARPLYTLVLDFDYAQHSARVQQTIQTVNPADQTLTELILIAEPLRQAGVLLIEEITLDGAALSVPPVEQNRIRLPLPAPLEPGQPLELSILFHLDLPAIPPPSDIYKPVPFGWTVRQTNLVDWYFFLPPYQPGQGWLAHEPGYMGEHLVYPAADFDVTLRRTGAQLDYTVAASAPAEEREGGFHYRLENARTFALSASMMYEVAEQQVGEVTITSYAFPFHLNAGKQALADTAAALELYARLFGPYPYRSMTVVEADFLDGMEYSGLYFLSRGFYDLYDSTPRGYLTIIAVHETAHQWWYSLVGNDQAMQPWLDEALCTFSELLFYENVYPELADWWRSYRVEFYDPQGTIDLSIYDYQGFIPYRNAVYLRGALFLDELRTQMGNEAFLAFLRDYTDQYTSKIVSQDDFFHLLAGHNPGSLDHLIEEYFQTAEQ